MRHAKQLSQEKLAELADINRTYLGDVERGTRNIAIENMQRIAQGLGMPLSRLIKEMEGYLAESSVEPAKKRKP